MTSTDESRPAANGAAASEAGAARLHPSVPVAVITGVYLDRRGARSVTVRCPYGCKHDHSHGWPAGWDWPGLRVPHCLSDAASGSYDVRTIAPGVRLTGRVGAE